MPSIRPPLPSRIAPVGRSFEAQGTELAAMLPPAGIPAFRARGSGLGRVLRGLRAIADTPQHPLPPRPGAGGA